MKKRVPRFVSPFVRLINLRTDYTQICVLTSCVKAAKQTSTIAPRHGTYVGRHPRGHQYRANPLNYWIFHRSYMGFIWQIQVNKTKPQWMRCFAPTTQHPGHVHPKDFCIQMKILSKAQSWISHWWRLKNVCSSRSDQNWHPQIWLWKPKRLCK